ncbi:MAG: hypothetical protein OXI69_00345 [Acidobacteriota bacterium]|nr:hypothetical protein [Acidobacteriota bacterium]
MGRKGVIRMVVVACLLGLCLPAAAEGLLEKNPELGRQLREGLQLLYRYDLDQAERVFTQMVEDYPDRPIGYAHLGGIFWWKALLDKRNKQLARSFEKYTTQAIDKGQALVEKDAGDFYAWLYVAAAYANRSRFKVTITRSYLGAMLAGLKGRSYNARAAALRPDHVDCLMGIGGFNYFSGALPAVIKPFAFLIGARGDRELGLSQLETVAQKGEYGQTAAKLILLGVYYNERRYDDYSDLLFRMIEQFPPNPVFYMWLSNAFVQRKRVDEGVHVFNRWIEEAGRDGAPRRPLEFLEKEKDKLESRKGGP